MEKIDLAILGVTGAVRLEMFRILEEKDFSIGDLKLLVHKSEAGKNI